MDKRMIKWLKYLKTKEESFDQFNQIVDDDLFIGYNNTNSYQKIDLNNLLRKELLIDDKLFNSNFKKRIELNYLDEIIYYNNDEFFFDLKEIEKKDNIKIFHHLILKPLLEINNQKDFEKKLQEIKITGKKPTLLLHSCCGPCSSYVIEYLQDYFDISILYYNPNIDTYEEFNKRLNYQKLIINKINKDIKLIIPEYDHNEYLEYIKGLENLHEGEKRCYYCYEERLKKLFLVGDNFDFVTTTLSVSPYKNANWLNEIGKRLEQKLNLNCHYLYSNFKLNNGYKRSIELSKQYNLYRQEYCGCEFSLREMKND